MGISFPDTMLAISAFPVGKNQRFAAPQAEPGVNVSHTGLVSFQCQKGQVFIKIEKWQMHQMKENERQINSLEKEKGMQKNPKQPQERECQKSPKKWHRRASDGDASFPL